MPRFDGAAGRTARRWLFLIHRWIGIASCLLFAMWFASGLVMIYVPYPSLTPAAALAGAQPIDWQQVTGLPPLAGGRPRGLALEMRDGVAVWRVEGWDGTRVTLPADGQSALAPADGPYAARVAGRFAQQPVAGVERIERDQWTVAGSFDRHRPLWRVDLADRAGTSLYVSSNSGAVVQRTTQRQRFWNWLGAVPHWLYPTVLRRSGPAWRQVVLWVSGPCIAVAVTGLWIGLLRARFGRRRYKGGRVTPYRGWMLWHHLAGLAGGLFLLAWIFSGWLSVDPGRLFQRHEPDRRAQQAYASAPISDLTRHIGTLGAGAVWMELTGNAGRPLAVLLWPKGRRAVLDPASSAPGAVNRAALLRASRRLVPDGRLVEAKLLTSPDAYWYEAGARLQLPVLRLRFDDPQATWLHLDPVTGEVLGRLDRRRRLYRWLFDLLHKWDLNALTSRRPVWDGLLWLLSALGLVTSISGIWLGGRRLFRSRRRPDGQLLPAGGVG